MHMTLMLQTVQSSSAVCQNLEGTIRISDKGEGMDVDTIKNYWLVLGNSPKTGVEVTPLGRRVAGSKGLGRLSALRLGTVTSLTSVEHTDLKSKHSITIDWD